MQLLQPNQQLVITVVLSAAYLLGGYNITYSVEVKKQSISAGHS